MYWYKNVIIKTPTLRERGGAYLMAELIVVLFLMLLITIESNRRNSK